MASSYLILAALMAVLLLFFSPAPAVAGIVTDADGEMVYNGRAGYYIVPSTPHVLGSGALSWIPNNNSTCPLFVKSKGNSDGTLASISWPPRVLFVATSSYVTITFHDTNAPCSEELSWFVTSGEANDDQLYVTAGPSGSTVFGGFQIKEADTEKNEFYIKFCHSSECDDVGFLTSGLLGITPNKPVPFRFVKAFSDLRMPVDRV